MDARRWDERYAATDLVWSAEPNRFLVAEVDRLPPGRALDVACGEGRNAIWLAGRGWEVVGVDFSAVAIDKARKLAAQAEVEVTWEHADVVTDPLPGGAFDLVVVLYLQLPAEPRRTALGAAARAVGPGGTLLVVAHDRTNVDEGHGGPQDPEVLYGPDDVVDDIAGAELAVERAERVRRPVATDAGEVTAVDLLVRAHR